jgi:hypothetical protein
MMEAADGLHVAGDAVVGIVAPHPTPPCPYPSGGVQGVKTFEEISVRPTVGADGGTSMIVKTVNSETGETLKVVHRVVDATGKVIHEDVKFP